MADPVLERSSDICISITKVAYPGTMSYSLIHGVHRLLYRAGGGAGDTQALWAMIQTQLEVASVTGVSPRCSVLVDSRIWGAGR